MPDEWADSGLDLHLDLPRHRIRAGIVEQLRAAVAEGRLPGGTRLPPTRTLAADLGLARNTVADAYAQLVAEGWLDARSGSGTVVAERPTVATAAPAADAPPPEPPLDLRAGTPDLSAFPRTAWSRALRLAVADAPVGRLGYGDPQGLPEVREVLAAHLARTRGVHAAPDRVVVTTGFAGGMAALARVLGAGTRVGVEAPSLAAHRAALADAGLVLLPMPVDERGASPAGLDCAAALLTPAHQFPTGVVLSPDRRRTFAGAARAGLLLVEDDYDGEFRYDRDPVGALQALAPDDSVYAGTASKTLAPALRLGWLVVPARLRAAVADAADGPPPAIEQLALAQLLASGAYDAHVRRMRTAYRRRRDLLVAALAGAPVRIEGVAAGLHVLVRLPDGTDEEDVVAAGLSRGLALERLAPYRVPGAPALGPGLVVGYATPPAHRFEEAVAALAQVLHRI